MKTAKEIRKYLRQQKWYKDYVRNVKKYPYRTKKDKKELLRGYLKGNTIIYAFRWIDTLQGQEYWCKVERKFINWYNKENKKYEKS